MCVAVLDQVRHLEHAEEVDFASSSPSTAAPCRACRASASAASPCRRRAGSSRRRRPWPCRRAWRWRASRIRRRCVWNSEPGSPTWPNLISSCAYAGSATMPRHNAASNGKKARTRAAQANGCSIEIPPEVNATAPSRARRELRRDRAASCARILHNEPEHSQGSDDARPPRGRRPHPKMGRATDAVARRRLPSPDRPPEHDIPTCAAAGVSPGRGADAGLAARLRARRRGRRAVRRAPRAAATRPTRRSTRSSRSASWCRPRDDDVRAAIDVCRELRRAGAAARRRQLAVRADGRRGAGHRPQQAPRTASSRFDREAMTVTVEPGIVLDQLNAWLKPHGAVVPGRRQHLGAGDARRHGRQQLLRLALDRLRQHGAQRRSPIDALLADGTEARFGPEREMDGGAAAGARARSTACARSARASATRSTARAEGAAPRRRLQPRRLPSAERAPVHRRRQRQPRAPAGRQRRHARVDARRSR